MTETFCDSGAVKLKAGSNLPTLTAAQYTQLINQAESYINVLTKVNYTDTYSGLDADLKMLLEEACSNIAAIYTIQYDMSGYTSRAEAQTMLNVLWDRVDKGIELLKEKQNTDFINQT